MGFDDIETFPAETVIHLAGEGAGIVLYGAFVAKIVLVQSPRWRVPGWALPVVGGTLVVVVAVLSYTSALWYFNDFRLPSF